LNQLVAKSFDDHAGRALVARAREGIEGNQVTFAG
jgi:hypothetical protein